MFEASLVESTSILHTRNRWPALLSFALQATLVTALILIPLTHPEIVPLHTPRISLVAPRFFPTQPPPIVQPVRLQTASVSSTPAAPTQAARIPHQAFNSDAQTVDTPALAVGMNLGLANPSPLSSLTGTAPTGARVAIAATGSPAATSTAAPLAVSRGVIAGHLLAPIQPQYPPIARSSRTEGTVIVQAIISKSGRIESAHVVSGPELLQTAALQAVRDARYRPFLLNDQPTEVETTISIVFQLHN
jgi:periplasmic protein TonB